jgi:hypothetical protein
VKTLLLLAFFLSTLSVFGQSLNSGNVAVFPLDLGVRYYANIGGVTEWCDAAKTSEISCTSTNPPYPLLHRFHAAIVSQGVHEFLIGCLSADFESGNWNCVNLTAGAYTVQVHNQTLIVMGDQFAEINSRTGERIRPITPVFSILATLK